MAAIAKKADGSHGHLGDFYNCYFILGVAKHALVAQTLTYALLYKLHRIPKSYNQTSIRIITSR